MGPTCPEGIPPRGPSAQGQADKAQILDQMTSYAMEAMQGFDAYARSLMAKGATPDKVAGLLLVALDGNILRLLDLYKTQKDVEPACKRGCWWCCTIQVVVAPLEALHIAAWLERNGRFTKGLGKRLRAVSEQRWEQHRAKCAFLRDGECTIYLVRPVRCRGYYGTDDKICRASYLYGHAVAGDVETLAATQMVGQGMVAAMMRAVMERKSLLLEDAILAVHEAGGAERAWERLRVPLPVFGREWPCVTLEEYAFSLEAVGPVQV